MRKKQQGLSTIGWLVVISIVGSIAFCAIKIIPVYVENLYVTDALKFLADNNNDLKDLSKEEIKSQLSKYSAVNSLGRTQSKSFKVKRYQNRLIVNSVYEVRIPMVHNIDVVMSFKSQLDTDDPDACCEYLIEDWNEKR